MMYSGPKISVIIPVYNTAEFLPACLDSCLAQTLYDVEFICVNDGSEDNSASVLDRYARQDKRFRIVEKKNGGLSSARNAGLCVATGTIVMFLDSDDTFVSQACERVWMEYCNGYFDILAFSAECFPGHIEPPKWMKEKFRVENAREEVFSPALLFGRQGTMPFVWRQAFSKAFLDAHQLRFDESILFGEDMVFDMTAYPCGVHFAFIEDQLYRYRLARNNSLMANADAELGKKLVRHIEICSAVCKVWHENGWMKKYGKDFTQWMLGFMVHDIRRLPRKNTGKLYQSLYALMSEYDLIETWYDQLNYTSRWLARCVKKGA